MNEIASTFFDKYKDDCKKAFGSVHIPKLDSKNGIPGKNIMVMFVNERPGRVGTGKSDLISYQNQDQTAYRFKRLFEKVLGISRKKIIITNACIFYPLRKNYRDRPLNKKEWDFSINNLKDQIKRINPKVIVPLGNTALYALKNVYLDSQQLKKFKLKTNIGKQIIDPMPLFPLYHTSSRAVTTRSEKRQEKDWLRLKRFINSL